MVVQTHRLSFLSLFEHDFEEHDEDWEARPQVAYEFLLPCLATLIGVRVAPR